MKNRIELIDSPANTQRNRLSRASSSLHFIYIELPPIKPVKEHSIQAGLIYGILSENTKRRRPHKASKITSLTPPFLLHLVFYFSLYSINYYISLLQCVLALIPLANIISSLRQYFHGSHIIASSFFSSFLSLVLFIPLSPVLRQ